MNDDSAEEYDGSSFVVTFEEPCPGLSDLERLLGDIPYEVVSRRNFVVDVIETNLDGVVKLRQSGISFSRESVE